MPESWMAFLIFVCECWSCLVKILPVTWLARRFYCYLLHSELISLSCKWQPSSKSEEVRACKRWSFIRWLKMKLCYIHWDWDQISYKKWNKLNTVFGSLFLSFSQCDLQRRKMTWKLLDFENNKRSDVVQLNRIHLFVLLTQYFADAIRIIK